MVQSVSWPTAEISGIALAAAARATLSSLKPHRSSRLPPPRATMIRSGRGTSPLPSSRLKPIMAADTSTAQVSPCTRTGHTSTWQGKRSSRRWRMSRITAPVGEVTTPMMRGRYGSGPLAPHVEQAFGGQPFLALLEQRHQRAGAGRLELVDHDLIFRPVGIGGDAALDDDFEPVLGLEFEPLIGAAPDHRLDRRLVVLEREIAMAARVLALEAGNLAAQPHQAIGLPRPSA